MISPIKDLGGVGSERFQKEIDKLRNSLLQRRLFKMETYGDTEENDSVAVGILSTISPLKKLSGSIDFISSVVGDKTSKSKLVEIGLEQYNLHMLYNTTTQIATKTIPTIDISGAVRGEDFFGNLEDMAISTPSKNWLGRAGLAIGDSLLSNNPFTDITSGFQRRWKQPKDEDDLLDFTGKGQLKKLYALLDRNKYVDDNFINKKYDAVGKKFKSKGDGWNNRFYYNSYNRLTTKGANSYELISKLSSEDGIPDSFLTKYEIDYEIDYRLSDDESPIKPNFIWNSENPNGLGDSGDKKTGVKLLRHTQALMVKYGGEIIDQTRKEFKDGNRVVGYVNPALYRSNDSEFDLRQHTILDPYTGVGKSEKDKPIKKLIRYVGNKAYNENGPNVDSVIYKTVLPKLHPTHDGIRESETDINKNLMLSIENLAVKTSDMGEYGELDDGFNTPVHWSEIGPNGGRLMWFPPYNLKISETSSPKFESTVMLGRGEPMFNYMNTERGMTVSFTMIIDHPEQIENLNKNDSFNQSAAEFFAFGGDPLSLEDKIRNDVTPTNEKIKITTPNFGKKLTKERVSPFMNKFLAFKESQYYPVYNTQTPTDFHKRLTFLHQCTRQGNARGGDISNSVFGRQPICVLRIGDFIYSKVIIENLTIDYNEATWDLNPEGLGAQPMIADITLQIKLIGGQSLAGPVDVIQNAHSENYYANSTFKKDGEFMLPYTMGEIQRKYNKNPNDDEIKTLLEGLKNRTNIYKKNNI